jgi:hypothetical protein
MEFRGNSLQVNKRPGPAVKSRVFSRSMQGELQRDIRESVPKWTDSWIQTAYHEVIWGKTNASSRCGASAIGTGLL